MAVEKLGPWVVDEIDDRRPKFFHRISLNIADSPEHQQIFDGDAGQLRAFDLGQPLRGRAIASHRLPAQIP